MTTLTRQEKIATTKRAMELLTSDEIWHHFICNAYSFQCDDPRPREWCEAMFMFHGGTSSSAGLFAGYGKRTPQHQERLMWLAFVLTLLDANAITLTNI